jgi:Tfp pilus assembly protein PilX
MRPALLSRQRGITLIVSMIMLMLITMLAISSFRLGSGNLQIVGNMQQRGQTLSAAQGAIEQVVSNPNFSATPTNAVPAPCTDAAGQKQPNTACVDVNGDGSTDVTVAVGSTRSNGQWQTAPCVQQVKPVTNASLDLSRTEDASCAIGVGQTFGVAGSASGNSMCNEMLWDVEAVASDATQGASTTVAAGVRVRTSSDDANSTYNCN